MDSAFGFRVALGLSPATDPEGVTPLKGPLAQLDSDNPRSLTTKSHGTNAGLDLAPPDSKPTS
jgi:hypothetical protein